MAQWCEIPASQYRRRGFDPWVGKIPWRRKWKPTPLFLPGESHGQRSLVGYSHRVAKTWISHGCTCVPHPEPPSHLPPHPIPQGHPSAPALSTLSHASNQDWLSISHMVIYMFQWYSLKSSHPHLLPHRPKACSLHLCLISCLAYRVIVTVFKLGRIFFTP